MRAALLLLVFLAAGTSLPSLDALIYHGLGHEGQIAERHLEPAGGCLDHDQHCGLGRTAPGSGAVAPTGSPPRLQPAPRLDQPIRPAQSAASIPSKVLPPPRAPPSVTSLTIV